MDVEKFLSLDTSAQKFMVKRSPIFHSDARLDFFASRRIAKVEMFRHCHGFLVYVSLAKEQHNTRTYQEGVM